MRKSFEPQELDFAGRNKVKAGERVLATAMAISSMLLLPLELCAQTIAPTASLKSDPPVEVVPQEDFVLQRRAPAAIPFRPTISASAYDAAKQAAEAGYSPLGRKAGSIRTSAGRAARSRPVGSVNHARVME